MVRARPSLSLMSCWTANSELRTVRQLSGVVYRPRRHSSRQATASLQRNRGRVTQRHHLAVRPSGPVRSGDRRHIHLCVSSIILGYDLRLHDTLRPTRLTAWTPTSGLLWYGLVRAWSIFGMGI